MILYLGCLVPERLPSIEAATRFVIDRIGADLADSPVADCCFDPAGMSAVDPEGWESAVSRIHSAAGGEGIVTLCDGCSLSLSQYDGGNRVDGFMAFLHSNLAAVREAVTKPLGMEVASFPGCHCVDVCERNGQNAVSMMTQLLEALGCETHPPGRNLCCGGNVSGINDELSRKVLAETLRSFGDRPVAVTCPFCFVQFDMVARKKTYHIAELAAMAMGWDVDPLDYHRGK
ncbi:MAG: hypothetical protein GX224_01485 [Thermoplasmatales archaeon]|nr:hypothetical protein [Thermoplasmatales archaeon]